MNCSQPDSKSSSPEEGWCQHYLAVTRKKREGGGKKRKKKDFVLFQRLPSQAEGGPVNAWLLSTALPAASPLASPVEPAAKAASEQETN